MTNKWKGRRTLSLLLAFAMLLTMSPPVYSTGNTEDYYANIGGTAMFNPECNAKSYYGSAYLQDDPQKGWTGGISLSFEGHMDLVMVVVDCYVASDGLWYKVEAAEGHTLPDEMVERPWVYQNDIPNDGYPDTLIITPPEPTSDISTVTTNTGIYGALIGATGTWNDGHMTYKVTADPTQGTQAELSGTDVYISSLLIENVHWDATTMQLWLKVAAPEGKTLPEKLQQYPWVYQNTTSVYATENWQQTSPDVLNLTLPNNGKVDMATGVAVSGLPEGASLEVKLPTVGGEALPGVYDIKIYDANGNEWQPIDHGQTVTLSIPVEGDIAKVTHFIDHAPAILNNPNVQYWSLEGVNAELQELLKDAIAACGTPGYVAVEVKEEIQIVKGIATFEADSFSYYRADGTYVDQTAVFVYCDDGTGTSLADKNANSENKHNLPILREDGVYDNGQYFITTAGSGQGTNKITIQAAWEGVAPDECGATTAAKITVYREKVTTPGVLEVWKNIQNTTMETVGHSNQVGRTIAKHNIAIETTPAASVQGDKYHITITDSANGCTAYLVIVIANVAENYTATYTDPNGRFQNETVEYHLNTESKNDETKTLPNKEADGYKLTGWKPQEPIGNWESNKIYLVGEALGKHFGNVTLLAQWTPQYKYNITFDDGVADEEIDVLDPFVTPNWEDYATVTIPLPSVPQREGYAFAGWSVSTGTVLEADVEEFTAEGVPAGVANVTLTALWKADTDIKYTVKHYYENLSGGFDDPQEVILYGETGTPTNATPFNKTGFISIEEEDIVQKNIAGDESTVIEIYYYRESKDVTWRWYDDTEGEKTVTVSYKYGATINVIDTPVRNAYTFARWDGYSDGMTMPANEVTFTAIWTAKVFQVYFMSNGGSAIDPIKVDFDESVPKPEDPTRTGYRFLGWYTDKECTSLADFNTLIMPANDLVLYAKWEINQYKITFDSDGGGAVATQTVPYGTTLTAFPVPTAKTGYKFTGWMYQLGDQWFTITDSEGKIEMPNGDTQYTVPAMDITLKAGWELVKLTVVFDKNASDATGSMDNQVFEYGVEQSISANAFSRTGYIFKGWSTTSSDSNTVEYTDQQSYSYTGTADATVTIYAVWEKVMYKITYNLDGGTNNSGNPATYTVEDTITLQDPTKDGYNFLGWYTDTGFTNRISQISGSTGNLILYAKWEAALASLTINVNFANDASKDEEQTFIFQVTGDGVDVTVVVQGRGQVVIAGLTIGKTYTITPKNGWSWRYGAMGTTTVEITVGGSTATFAVNRSKTQWLDSNAYYKN